MCKPQNEIVFDNFLYDDYTYNNFMELIDNLIPSACIFLLFADSIYIIPNCDAVCSKFGNTFKMSTCFVNI